MVKFRVRESKPEPEEPVVDWWTELDDSGNVHLRCSHGDVTWTVCIVGSTTGKLRTVPIPSDIPGLTIGSNREIVVI